VEWTSGGGYVINPTSYSSSISSPFPVIAPPPFHPFLLFFLSPPQIQQGLEKHSRSAKRRSVSQWQKLKGTKYTRSHDIESWREAFHGSHMVVAVAPIVQTAIIFNHPHSCGHPRLVEMVSMVLEVFQKFSNFIT